MSRSLTLVSAALLGGFGLGCDGEIGDAQIFVPGVGLVGPDAGGSGGSVSTPDGGTVGGPTFNPFEGGSLTLGVLCGAEGAGGHFVITEQSASCSDHAELLSGGQIPGNRVIVDTPVINGPGTYTAVGEVCLGAECSQREVTIEVDAIAVNGAVGRWAIPLDGRTAAGPLQAQTCEYDAFLPGRDPYLAPNLDVTEVVFYQGTRVTLADRSGPIPLRELPVVQRRPGLLRVFVEPQPGYLQDDITAVLTLVNEGTASQRRVTRPIAITSTEQSRGTTLDFLLEAGDVGPDTEWSLALRGSAACSGVGQETSGARMPTSGETRLNAETVGVLQVRLVPFRYTNGASEVVPNLSENVQESYRRTLLALFPVEEVEVSVREPVDLDPVVGPSPLNWSGFLSQLRGVRATDNPPDTVYYYGLVDASGGGIAGLAPLAPASDVSRRAAVGLAGAGPLTCAHELGHAAGRRHAPSGNAPNADPAYPYPDGRIGVWGYDILSDDLKSPETFYDLMGYRGPDWISDFNYLAIFNRYVFVNQTSADFVGVPEQWRSVVLAADGNHLWGPEVTLARPPFPEDVTPVRYLDNSGRLVHEEDGVVVVLDHSEDIIVDVPAAPADTAFVSLEGRTIPY